MSADQHKMHPPNGGFSMRKDSNTQKASLPEPIRRKAGFCYHSGMKLRDVFYMLIGTMAVLFGLWIFAVILFDRNPPSDMGKTAIVLIVGVVSFGMGASILWLSLKRDG
jgi:hypothetical protein